MPTIAFPDTNILMEFRPLREIPWRKLLDVPKGEVLLVIAQQVTGELNQHKGGSDKRRRDRAKRATKDLEQFETSGHVPGFEGLRVVFGQQPPAQAFLTGNHLVADEGDDRILGSMLLMRQSNPNDQIILVSDDINHRQRAKGYGFDARGIPDEFRLPAEADPRDAKIKEQDARIRELTDVVPILELVFDNRLREAIVPRPVFTNPSEIASLYIKEMNAAQSALSARYAPSSDWMAQLGVYQREEFPRWANKQAVEESRLARTVQLGLRLKNKGKSNAKSAVVDVTVPSVLEHVNLPIWFVPLPRVPHPHVEFDPDREYYGAGLVPKLMKAPTGRIEPRRGDDVEGPVLIGDHTLRYTYSHELAHRSDCSLGDLFLTFDPAEKPGQAFELPYKAHADGTPTYEGRLLVKLE
jgi:PIN domain